MMPIHLLTDPDVSTDKDIIIQESVTVHYGLSIAQIMPKLRGTHSILFRDFVLFIVVSAACFPFRGLSRYSIKEWQQLYICRHTNRKYIFSTKEHWYYNASLRNSNLINLEPTYLLPEITPLMHANMSNLC